MNPISRLLNGITDKYFDKWTGVHFLVNLVIMRSMMQFYDNVTSAVVTLSIAVAWEVYEYFAEGIAPYGSLESYKRNTLSDLAVAVLCVGVLF